MKNKLLVIAAAIIMVFAGKTANAQAFYQGVFHLSAGFGLGGYLDYASFGEFSETPTLFVAGDYGIIDDVGPGNVGIGAFLAYKSAKYDYSYGGGFNDTGEWTNFVLGVRGTYHYYLDNDNLDLYGALSIGVIMESYDYTTDFTFPGYTDDYYDYNNSTLYSAVSFGAKYMFTEQLGAFAELGWDIAWLKLGVTLGL